MGLLAGRGFDPDETFITTGEAAKILHVSAKTVARWAIEGKLPHLVTLGGHRRFPLAAIQEIAAGYRSV